MFKPIGRKNYGSIGHLPCSRMGPADRKISLGQANIATLKKRDKFDTVIVQEKLDGSNVGVAMKDGKIFPLTRSGIEAKESRYEMHHAFHDWAMERESLFKSILSEGDRICGEWLHTAHGTIYSLPHEPFVTFDLIDANNERVVYDEFIRRIDGGFVTPYLVSKGDSISVNDVLSVLGEFGKHGAQEKIEGAVWRVERKGKVDFLCKYVRPDKIDGKYLGLESEIKNTWIE